VFVHGISGNRYSTWTKNGVLWPQALLPEDVRKARILTAGYSADVASIDADHELEETTIKHHATDICERLSLLRTETNSVQRIFTLLSRLQYGEDTMNHKLTSLD
jgi:hypothetical protein